MTLTGAKYDIEGNKNKKKLNSKFTSPALLFQFNKDQENCPICLDSIDDKIPSPSKTEHLRSPTEF